MEKLNPFPFTFTSCNCVIGYSHVISILILIIAASVGENLIFVEVVIAIISFSLFSPFADNCFSPFSSFFKELFFMVEIVFKLLLEGHLIHISNPDIFIDLFRGTSWWFWEGLFFVFFYTFPLDAHFMSHINLGLNAFILQLFLNHG